MADTLNHWPSGIRDTTEFPKVNIDIGVSLREHLNAFIKMDQVGWTDYDAMNTVGSTDLSGSRLRTYRKMYEKFGLIYCENNKIKLSRLGYQMAALEPNLENAKNKVLNELRTTAIEILSRYQLRNPQENEELPKDCDILPAICIWRAMRELDDKLHPEEINRVILWIMKMEDLDEGIIKIKNARVALNGKKYTSLTQEELRKILGSPVHTEQIQARIAPWFSFVGWGGLLIEQAVDENGYRKLVEPAIPIIDKILEKSPVYVDIKDEKEWLDYYIGEKNEEDVSNKTMGERIKFYTGFTSDFERNRILFGAPGTGKSYTLNKEKNILLGVDNEINYERVTFHPDYSYANFVGTYKPVPYKDESGKDSITYKYVPGPFMRIYVKAILNGRTENVKPYILIIEEINRANVAAVFGDVFQLLDRDDYGISEYPIQASEDMKKYLAEALGGDPDDFCQLRIPDNMFIWATMNSADQGVFPMDTAFKRRWDFTYLGIDDSENELIGKYVVLGNQNRQKVEWNKLRKAINVFLAKQKINEDKQLGPYFISRSIVVPKETNVIDRERFIKTFKNKVIMYLFEDAARQKRSSLFEGCFENSIRYSEICREFDEKGIGIFNHDIQIACELEDISNESE